MIKYGTQQLKVLIGTLSIAKENQTEIRNYPGLDISDYFDLGKTPTNIAMEIKAESEEERYNIIALLHTPAERELQIGNIYYKKVIPDPEFEAEPMANDEDGYYRIPCQLIALDPVPYDINTDEVMY
ncbi:MAG: hypothetical protein ACQEQD_04425 [Bacillota bacterium]